MIDTLFGGEFKNFFLSGIERKFLGCPVRSLVTTPHMVLRLHYPSCQLRSVTTRRIENNIIWTKKKKIQANFSQNWIARAAYFSSVHFYVYRLRGQWVPELTCSCFVNLFVNAEDFLKYGSKDTCFHIPLQYVVSYQLNIRDSKLDSSG
jgi:hypothetical protein